MNRSVFWIYLEYYWLRFREIFDRKISRKLMWGLYWETKQRIIDLKLRNATSKYEEKEISKGLELTRKIMRHLIDLEGGKSR